MSVCTNCGEKLNGKYCSSCGQKKFSSDDLSIKKLVLGYFEDFFKFDLNILGTLRVLLFSPGRLSLDYINGKIARYVKPFKLFIFTSILVFVIGIYLSKEDYTFAMDDLQQFKDRIDYIAQHDHLSNEVVLEKFNKSYYSLQPVYVLALAVILAIALNIIFRNKALVFGAHFIFAIHFSIAVLYFILASIFLEKIYENIYFFFYYILPLIYLFIAVKTFYSLDNRKTLQMLIPLSIIYTVMQLSWIYLLQMAALYTI